MRIECSKSQIYKATNYLNVPIVGQLAKQGRVYSICIIVIVVLYAGILGADYSPLNTVQGIFFSIILNLAVPYTLFYLNLYRKYSAYKQSNCLYITKKSKAIFKSQYINFKHMEIVSLKRAFSKNKDYFSESTNIRRKIVSNHYKIRNEC